MREFSWHLHSVIFLTALCCTYLEFSFFFNDTATTEIYTRLHTLSLHDALPILSRRRHTRFLNVTGVQKSRMPSSACDRKSTRLNSSHIQKSRMPSSA